MSDSVLLTIRTNKSLKEEVSKMLKALGLNMSVVVNAYLHEIVRTKKVAFSLDENPSEYLLKILSESKKDQTVSEDFSSASDAVAWLHRKKKTYAHTVHKTV